MFLLDVYVPVALERPRTTSCKDKLSPPRPPASHDLTNVIYRGVAGKEKGGQGRAPSPYQLLLDKLVKSNLLMEYPLLTWGMGASITEYSSTLHEQASVR